jgi:REP element-mobilizing transposase RayT
MPVTFRKLAKVKTISEWKGVEILELNVQPDHVHLACNMPPKLSVSVRILEIRFAG